MFRVINTAAYMTDEARGHLTSHGCEVLDCDLYKLTEEEFCLKIAGVEAVIAGSELWTETVLGAAESLRIVARTGAGVDTVDLEAAARRGIWVTNTPGATSPAVADFTLGLILCLLRNIPAVARDMKDAKWEQYCGRDLGSLTLGVVGAGSIGREVIKRARGFGARALACDIAPDDEFAREFQVEYVPLDELMARADIVSIHVSLNEQTRGLIDERRLGLMKKLSYLINTSRPAVVDKAALVKLLEAREIAGAAIDVHDPEPPAPDDPLVALDNVIATPWTAYKTQETISRMCIGAATDVVTVLEGGAPRFPVNRPDV